MPKQHYRYSYDTIHIFQKLCDYYAFFKQQYLKKSEISPKCPLLIKVENCALKTHGRITNRLNLVDKARINSEIGLRGM